MLYTEEIAIEILERLSNGEPLRQICRSEHIPPASTVRGWVVDDREGFAERYARAREVQAEHLADEILAIADDGTGDTWIDEDGKEQVNYDHIQRSKLRVDARKWLLSKMAPKKYGERTQMEVSGADGAPLFKAIVGIDTDKV